MLVAGGLTALVLRWDVLVRTFNNLSAGRSADDEFPLRWVVIGVAISAPSRWCVVQKVSLGHRRLDHPRRDRALAAADARRPARARRDQLGADQRAVEHDAGHLRRARAGEPAANMVASGTTGTIAVESEALMQDYKAGYMIGSTPRYLTIMQLSARRSAPPRCRGCTRCCAITYGIVGENAGLSSPISRQVGRLRRDPVAGLQRAAARRGRRAVRRRRCSASCLRSSRRARHRSGCRRRPASASACWCRPRSSS